MRARFFTCKRDGLTIRGKEFLPEKHFSHKFPVMIFCHGFYGNYLSTQTEGRHFAKLGYASYVFDFNGGGPASKSEGHTEDMSVLTEVEDLKAVISYVKNLSYTDDRAITLVGQSQGGMVSALTAAELKNQVAGLILQCPAFCIPDDLRRGKASAAVFDPEHIPKTLECRKMILGKRYITDLIDMDPFSVIGDYPGSVMILHGTDDPVVPIDYSKRAQDIYNRKGIRCQLVVIPGAGHGFWPKYEPVVLHAMENFMQKRTLLLEIKVKLEGRKEEKRFRYKKTTLPFSAVCKTPYFEGKSLPGAKDVQERKSYFEIIQFRAEYTLEGLDMTGKTCRIHVVNLFDGKTWLPEITTDSSALAFVNGVRCSCMLQGTKDGPVVRIFVPMPVNK